MKCPCGMCSPKLPVTGKLGYLAYPGQIERSQSKQMWFPFQFTVKVPK
jgi:hypothetical protein